MEVSDIKNSIELILDNNKAKSITSINLKNQVAIHQIITLGCFVIILTNNQLLFFC